jgi:hypothetical protein
MLDGDLVAEQAHPDVLAHELGGHSIVLSPQGDGGVAAHQSADLHRQELAQLRRGPSAGGVVAVRRGRIAQAGAGPAELAWSPSGDKIAFLAALPFPVGDVGFKGRIDAWVCDLVTRRLTKITSDPRVQMSLIWR